MFIMFIIIKRVHLNGFCIDKRERKIICAISIENLKRLFVFYLFVHEK